MATLSSRLVISLTDGVSGPAAKIKRSLAGLTGAVDAARAKPAAMLAEQSKKLYQQTRTGAATAGVALAGMIQQTKDFNEALYGYEFARSPDYMKGSAFDLKGLQSESKEVRETVRKVARDLGLIPAEVMKARTEVQKIGIEGATGQSLWMASLGLNMSDSKMPTDLAVKFLGSMYRSFEKQREQAARKAGIDPNDKAKMAAFDNDWLKGTAAKAAIAAAMSALDPRDLVEGARQFAPQWAQFGMSPEHVMGFLAHGSNYGFQAPELGTSFKSWSSRLVKPTNAGMRWMNGLGMDRSKFMDFSEADPTKATNQLQSLLGGSLGKKQKAQILRRLMAAQKEGTVGTPQFQQELTQTIAQMLGRKTEEDIKSIESAVFDATLTSGGKVDIIAFIKEGLAKNMPVAAMLEILEGRHFARSSPFFQYFEKLLDVIKAIEGVGGKQLDAIMTTRQSSDAGKLTALEGAWQNLMLTLNTSGVVTGLTNALNGLSAVLGAMPTGVVENLTTGLLGLAAVGLGGAAIAGLAAGLGVLKTAVMALLPASILLGRMLKTITGLGAAGSVLAGLGGAALFGRHAMVGSPVGLGAAGGGAWMGGAAGVGGAAVAGAGAAKFGGKMLARVFIPGVGFVLTAMGAYEAFKAYRETGSGWEAGKAFLGLGSAKAEGAPAAGQDMSQMLGIDAVGQAELAGRAPGGANPQAAVSAVRTAADEIRSIMASIDLQGEGLRIMQSLAAGLMAGAAEVRAAAQSAAAAQIQSAVRGAYADGVR